MKSKAYVAQMPGGIAKEALRRLNAWGVDNCWESNLVHWRGGVSWVAIREKSRTIEEWKRHVRGVLDAVGVGSRDLKLRLCTVSEARALIHPRVSSTTKSGAASETDDDTRVVEIRPKQERRSRGVGSVLQISKE